MKRGGFTLIELAVTVTVVAVLGSAIFAAANTMVGRGREAAEVAAARAVIAGYINASTENDGILMPGYDPRIADVRQKDGRTIHSPASARYPWRLLPYLDMSLSGSLYVNKNRKQVDMGDSYAVSLYPAFGMNSEFVGGYYQEGKLSLDEAEVATRFSKVTNPAKLMVFASSGTRKGSANEEVIHGFNKITPPNIYSAMWKGIEMSDIHEHPDDVGNIHFRYNGQAVVAFMDGHVQMMSPEQLRDMRFWSIEAERLDDPNYKAPPTVIHVGGRPGRR